MVCSVHPCEDRQFCLVEYWKYFLCLLLGDLWKYAGSNSSFDKEMKKSSFVKYCHAIMGNDTSFIVNLDHEVSPFTQPFMRGKYCYRCQIMMQNVKMLYVIHIWCADLERSTSITFWCFGGIWSMHYYLTAWAEEDLLKSSMLPTKRETLCVRKWRQGVSWRSENVSQTEGKKGQKKRKESKQE